MHGAILLVYIHDIGARGNAAGSMTSCLSTFSTCSSMSGNCIVGWRQSCSKCGTFLLVSMRWGMILVRPMSYSWVRKDVWLGLNESLCTSTLISLSTHVAIHRLGTEHGSYMPFGDGPVSSGPGVSLRSDSRTVSGTTWVSQYQKGKTNLDLLE